MNEVPATPVPARPPLAILLAQQQEHWQRGERVPAEAFLLRHPGLAGARDSAQVAGENLSRTAGQQVLGR